MSYSLSQMDSYRQVDVGNDRLLVSYPWNGEDFTLFKLLVYLLKSVNNGPFHCNVMPTG